MARLIVRSEKEEAACAFADTLAGAFQSALATHARDSGGKPAPVRLLGPAECPVFRLKNFYRFHFQVQADSSAALHDVLRAALATARPPSGVEFQVDIDPYSML
jgi:primosomal protein N' (replication factor Y)